MKCLNPTASLIAALSLSASCAPAVTADELVRYLGVSAWSTTVALPADSFTIEIYTIKDGAPDKRLVEGGKQPSRHFTVMAGPENNRFKMVLAYDDGVAITIYSDIFSPLAPTVLAVLPDKITEGGLCAFW